MPIDLDNLPDDAAELQQMLRTVLLQHSDPQAWLTDVLESIVSGRTKASELHTLLPWNWQSSRPTLNLNTAALAA